MSDFNSVILGIVSRKKIEEGLFLFPAHLSDTLLKLEISYCPELSLVNPLPRAGGWRAVGGLQPLRCLQKLEIESCPKLLSAYQTSSPSTSCNCPFPSSLQELELTEVGDMGTLEPLKNLTSLTRLSINNCGEDLRGEGLWTLVTQGQLIKLFVYDCPNFFVGSDLVRGLPDLKDQEQLLRCPPKLRVLWTDDVAGVLAASICAILSSFLTKLTLGWNKEVERFAKEQEEALQLLTSLQDLNFFDCDKLQCLPTGLHALPSLRRLEIDGCPAISSLPKDGFPISMEELCVSSSHNVELRRLCRKFVQDHPRIKLID